MSGWDTDQLSPPMKFWRPPNFPHLTKQERHPNTGTDRQSSDALHAVALLLPCAEQTQDLTHLTNSTRNALGVSRDQLSPRPSRAHACTRAHGPTARGSR